MKKKAAPKKRFVKKSPVKKPRASKIEGAKPTIPEFMALGPELSARLRAVAVLRGISFDDVLREAAQNFLESEFVDPTTDAKDEQLYPPTDHPLEEAPVVRSNEPSDDQVHERATLPGEVAPDNGTTH